jgi:cytochrome c oxidase subunit 2
MGSSFPLIPEQASTFAQDVDQVFYLLTGLTIFFSILVLTLLLFFAIYFRRGSKVNRDNPSTGDLRLELAWSIGPLIIGCFVYALAAKPFTSVYRPPADAMEIFVIGKRWMWHMQHTNGIRENNELHVPVGRAIKLTMISQDVIHGFYVPAFRMKRDVLPGRYNTCWFQATKPGKYHLFCTEYCGTNHSEMGGWVYVMDPADFEQWQSHNGNREVTQNETLETEGASLYQTLACGNCHGDQDNVHGPSLYGLFGRKRKLTNGQVIVADDDYIRESIVNPHAKIVEGYQDIMQGYPTGDGPGFLTEEQLLSLVAYIKTLGAASPTAALDNGVPKSAVKPAATTGTAAKRTTLNNRRQPSDQSPGALAIRDRNRIDNRSASAASTEQTHPANALVDTNR